MKRLFAFVFVVTSLFSAEPLSFALQHPARLAFYSLYAQSPSIKRGLSSYVTLMQTNEYEEEKVFFLDYGLATLQLDFRYGINEDSQLRLIAPIHYIYGGILDGFLDWFHSTTDTLHSAHNRYGKYRVHIHYGDVSKNSPFFSLGNIELQYKKALHLDFPAAIVFGMKLPTAAKSNHLGSGRFDFALEFIASKKFEEFSLLTHLSIASLGSFHLKDFAKSRRWIYEGVFEMRYKKWQLQYRFSSSPYRSSYKELDAISNTLNIGYALTPNLTLFISENLAPFYNSPDITFGLTYRF